MANVVVFNPPYFRKGSGRSSSNPGRRTAREALNGDIDAFLRESKRLLAPDGRVFAVLRPERREQALADAGALGLYAHEVCSVYTCEGGKHQLELLQFSAMPLSDAEPKRLKHLLHQSKGHRAYSEAVESFFTGKTSSHFLLRRSALSPSKMGFRISSARPESMPSTLSYRRSQARLGYSVRIPKDRVVHLW